MNLNAQVQSLSVKNNWLLKSMTENQQLFQEAELALVKTDKHLSSENNWLRNSMTESLQPLQEAELTLMKTTTDKQNLEIVQSQCNIQMDLNTIMDIDKQGEERTEVEDGKDTNSMLCVNDCALYSLEIPMGNTRETSMSIHQDRTSLEETSFECEIPEKIRSLHQLTLQNINQVKL